MLYLHVKFHVSSIISFRENERTRWTRTDGRTDGRTERRTETTARQNNIPLPLAGDNKVMSGMDVTVQNVVLDQGC